MRILILNGSPKKDGNTAIALHEMEKVFAEEGIETEIVQVGSKPIRGCIACGQCFEKGRCVFDDLVNQAAEKFKRNVTGLLWDRRCTMPLQMRRW